MSGLVIDSEACIGCGRCVRACASGGIVVEGERPNRCARVTDGCILCGGCVDACPVNAISIERDEATGVADLGAYRDIWVFVQTDEHDTVASVAYELMGKGRELADARGCRLVALVGMGPEGSLGDLEHLVCAGADEVLVCRDERLRQNDAEVYARLICDLVAERKPEAILYGASALARVGARRCRALADGPYSRLHRAFDGYGDGPVAADALGVWRQPDGYHRLPQPSPSNGYGASRHL